MDKHFIDTHFIGLPGDVTPDEKLELRDVRNKYGLSNRIIAEIIGVSKSSVDITTCKSRDPERSSRYASMLEAHIENMVNYFHDNWVHLTDYDIRGMAIVIAGTPGVYRIPREIKRVAQILVRK